MTQFHDPNNPYAQSTSIPYAPMPVPLPPIRPTSVTVLAILGIIWSALALFGAIINTLQLAIGPFARNDSNPMATIMFDDPLLFKWMLFATVLNFVIGGLLLTGSIAALRLKPLGRTCMIAYSWITVGITIVSCVFSVMFMIPKMANAIQNSNMPAQMKPMMQMFIWAGVPFSFVALVFPGFILYFMSRPHVKEAFKRGMVRPGSVP